MTKRALIATAGAVCLMAYPLAFTTPFQQRLGALVLLYAIAASACGFKELAEAGLEAEPASSSA